MTGSGPHQGNMGVRRLDTANEFLGMTHRSSDAYSLCNGALLKLLAQADHDKLLKAIEGSDEFKNSLRVGGHALTQEELEVMQKLHCFKKIDGADTDSQRSLFALNSFAAFFFRDENCLEQDSCPLDKAFKALQDSGVLGVLKDVDISKTSKDKILTEYLNKTTDQAEKLLEGLKTFNKKLNNKKQGSGINPMQGLLPNGITLEKLIEQLEAILGQKAQNEFANGHSLDVILEFTKWFSSENKELGGNAPIQLLSLIVDFIESDTEMTSLFPAQLNDIKDASKNWKGLLSALNEETENELGSLSRRKDVVTGFSEELKSQLGVMSKICETDGGTQNDECQKLKNAAECLSKIIDNLEFHGNNCSVGDFTITNQNLLSLVSGFMLADNETIKKVDSFVSSNNTTEALKAALEVAQDKNAWKELDNLTPDQKNLLVKLSSEFAKNIGEFDSIADKAKKFAQEVGEDFQKNPDRGFEFLIAHSRFLNEVKDVSQLKFVESPEDGSGGNKDAVHSFLQALSALGDENGSLMGISQNKIALEVANLLEHGTCFTQINGGEVFRMDVVGVKKNKANEFLNLAKDAFRATYIANNEDDREKISSEFERRFYDFQKGVRSENDVNIGFELNSKDWLDETKKQSNGHFLLSEHLGETDQTFLIHKKDFQVLLQEFQRQQNEIDKKKRHESDLTSETLSQKDEAEEHGSEISPQEEVVDSSLESELRNLKEKTHDHNAPNELQKTHQLLGSLTENIENLNAAKSDESKVAAISALVQSMNVVVQKTTTPQNGFLSFLKKNDFGHLPMETSLSVNHPNCPIKNMLDLCSDAGLNWLTNADEGGIRAVSLAFQSAMLQHQDKQKLRGNVVTATVTGLTIAGSAASLGLVAAPVVIGAFPAFVIPAIIALVLTISIYFGHKMYEAREAEKNSATKDNFQKAVSKLQSFVNNQKDQMLELSQSLNASSELSKTYQDKLAQNMALKSGVSHQAKEVDDVVKGKSKGEQKSKPQKTQEVGSVVDKKSKQTNHTRRSSGDFDMEDLKLKMNAPDMQNIKPNPFAISKESVAKTEIPDHKTKSGPSALSL